ncbi:MAG: hypothetical protein PWP76_331 [Candidatus Diapherotrites archaeon]|nr:hypothetical protein [Candidatus Diapherotrites archaeon]MDN5366702.1 hypothetical protein [Candidatus Diapherotrites archaeon]
MIADTSALIDHLRGVANASSADATTVITAFELLKWGRPGARAKIKAMLSNLHIYELDLESAEIAADIYLALKENGAMLAVPDILIAAIAVRNGEAVLTSDRDFKKIEEVFGAPKTILLR